MIIPKVLCISEKIKEKNKYFKYPYGFTELNSIFAEKEI